MRALLLPSTPTVCAQGERVPTRVWRPLQWREAGALSRPCLLQTGAVTQDAGVGGVGAGVVQDRAAALVTLTRTGKVDAATVGGAVVVRHAGTAELTGGELTLVLRVAHAPVALRVVATAHFTRAAGQVAVVAGHAFRVGRAVAALHRNAGQHDRVAGFVRLTKARRVHTVRRATYTLVAYGSVGALVSVGRARRSVLAKAFARTAGR